MCKATLHLYWSHCKPCRSSLLYSILPTNCSYLIVRSSMCFLIACPFSTASITWESKGKPPGPSKNLQGEWVRSSTNGHQYCRGALPGQGGPKFGFHHVARGWFQNRKLISDGVGLVFLVARRVEGLLQGHSGHQPRRRQFTRGLLAA